MVLSYNDKIYSLFYQLLVTMTVLKVVFVLYELHKLCNYDIFFLDWVLIFKRKTNILMKIPKKIKEASGGLFTSQMFLWN